MDISNKCLFCGSSENIKYLGTITNIQSNNSILFNLINNASKKYCRAVLFKPDEESIIGTSKRIFACKDFYSITDGKSGEKVKKPSGTFHEHHFDNILYNISKKASVGVTIRQEEGLDTDN